MIDLTAHNTFGVPASANRYIELHNQEELRDYAARWQQETERYYILGGGANVLFIEHFDGDILHFANTDLEIVYEDSSECHIRVGAGYVWDELVRWTIEHNLWGSELLSGIPGSVGAAPVQNIGAYGAEAADILLDVEALNLLTAAEIHFANNDLHLGYRTSRFKQQERGYYAIHHVTFRLKKLPNAYEHYQRLAIPENELTPAGVRTKVLEIRNSKLPPTNKLGSAGSFFKNPVVTAELRNSLLTDYQQMPSYAQEDGTYKLSAGWLIEHCGWKGEKRGNAGVYEHQALVLVNLGGATGKEILELSRAIASDVRQKMGVTLEHEVEIVAQKGILTSC